MAEHAIQQHNNIEDTIRGVSFEGSTYLELYRTDLARYRDPLSSLVFNQQYQTMLS